MGDTMNIIDETKKQKKKQIIITEPLWKELIKIKMIKRCKTIEDAIYEWHKIKKEKI